MTQANALDILKTGANVYLTGSAGSGKTYVLNSFITHLRRLKIKAGITASTGVAATHIGGMTINSWAGIGIKHTLSEREIAELLKRKYLRKRIQGAQVLIIDEISMLSSSMFEAIDKVCRAFKNTDAPFGGMQMVLCGDFFQLSPVQKTGAEIEFLYKSPVWEKLDLKVCYLDKPYRQIDKRFLHMLDEIRENSITKETWEIIKERFCQPLSEGVTPTKLYTHTVNVDAINEKELEKIPGQMYEYRMQIKGNEALAEVMKKNCLAPETLLLKKGALVMFVKNNSADHYVNGTMGRVIGFTDSDMYPVVQTYDGREIVAEPTEWEIEDDGEVQARLIQIPLRLAWAITIHKSQGMSLDAAEIDLGKSFICGMGYVALSRVRSLEGIRLRSINRTALSVHEEVIKIDKKFQQMSTDLTKEIQGQYWGQKHKGFLSSSKN